MNRTYNKLSVGAVLCLAAGGVCASTPSASPGEVQTWAGHFVSALQRQPSQQALQFTFADPEDNEPGSFPIAQRLILYRILLADDTLDPTEIGLNAVVIGDPGGHEIEPIDRACNGAVDVIDDPVDVVMFRDLMSTGRLSTGTSDPGAMERHIRAVLGFSGAQIMFEGGKGLSVGPLGLTSQDLRVTWTDATSHPASPASNLGPEVAALQQDLRTLAKGIAQYGIDRQPSPRSMVSGEMYSNATREILSLEMGDRKNVSVNGIAAVYRDNVLLLTLVEMPGAAFLVDGQQGEIFGPYASGTRLLPAVVDTLWAGGRIEPGEPVILYHAD